MAGAIFNHVGVDSAAFGGRIREWFGVDPETVDAYVVRAALVAGDSLWVEGVSDAMLASFAFGSFVRFENNVSIVIIGDFNVFPVGEREVEVA